MEKIIPAVLNLDKLVDSTFTDWNMKQQLMIMSKTEAETEAFSVLKQQFQNNLNEVLTVDIQQALKVEISDSSVMGIHGTFKYLDMDWNIYRIIQNEAFSWQISNKGITLLCFPDNFQKQLLIELGKAKAGKTPNDEP